MAFAFAAGPLAAQAPAAAKKAMTVDDYSKWRTISGQAISADGKWVAYVLELTNVVPAEAKPVLHLLNLETNADVTVNDASGRSSRRTPSGSPIRWTPARPSGRGPAAAAGRATPSARSRRQRPLARTGRSSPPPKPARAAAAARLGHPAASRRAAQPDHGGRPVLAGDRDVRFRPVVYPPRPPPARGRGRRPRGPAGRRRRTPGGARCRGPRRLCRSARPRCRPARPEDGRYQLLGSVGDFAFNRTGELLAYTVEAAVKDGNGLFVFDTRNGRVDAARQRRQELQPAGLERDGTALAVLKGIEVEKMREKTTSSSPSRTSRRP